MYMFVDARRLRLASVGIALAFASVVSSCAGAGVIVRNPVVVNMVGELVIKVVKNQTIELASSAGFK